MDYFFSESIGQDPLFEVTKTKSGKLYIEGIFAQADVSNGNKRIYPKAVLSEAINEYNEVWVKTNRALGEINHPSDVNPNPERACHIIEKISMDGSNAIGRARILESMPQGKIVKALIDEGVQLGVSTRGLGRMQETKSDISKVQKFKMFAVDVVSNPSAGEAFVNGIYEGMHLNRNNELIYNNELITENDKKFKTLMNLMLTFKGTL